MSIASILATKGDKVFTIRGEQSIREALVVLAQHNIGALVVVDAGFRPTGILSERDVVRAAVRNETTRALWAAGGKKWAKSRAAAWLDSTTQSASRAVLANALSRPRRSALVKYCGRCLCWKSGIQAALRGPSGSSGWRR